MIKRAQNSQSFLCRSGGRYSTWALDSASIIICGKPLLGAWRSNFNKLTWVRRGIFIPYFVGFSLITQKYKSCKPGIFLALSNFSLETFVLNFVFVTFRSLQILGKTQTMIFWISRYLVKSLIYKNCQLFRTSSDMDMKCGPTCN